MKYIKSTMTSTCFQVVDNKQMNGTFNEDKVNSSIGESASYESFFKKPSRVFFSEIDGRVMTS